MSALRFFRGTLNIDEFELNISCSDESSVFSVEMYSTTSILKDFAGKLAHLHKSEDILDFQFGRIGPEFAGGSASLRFHTRRDRVFVTARMQGRHEDFGRFVVAPEAIIYASFSLAALDAFATALEHFIASESNEAVLRDT